MILYMNVDNYMYLYMLYMVIDISLDAEYGHPLDQRSVDMAHHQGEPQESRKIMSRDLGI